jgi:hypothetical protein
MEQILKTQAAIIDRVTQWTPVLLALTAPTITHRKNDQNRSIKQLLGHLADSASNNTHRVVHLQYRENPMTFPNYATHGNNDRWIAIQHYQDEPWEQIVMLWKYANLHLAHVMGHINNAKLGHVWLAGPDEGEISLYAMVTGYMIHLDWHLSEIKALMEG